MRVLISNVFYRPPSHAAAALVAALAITPASALAAVQVSGNPQAVSITAQNTSIEEILSTLVQEFNLHYRSSVNLERRITGTYQGSLRRVLTRILEGYNFVVKMSDGRIQLTVLGTQLGTQNVPGRVEGLVPVPMPSSSSVSPPVPSSEAVGVVVPELRPSTVAPPLPLASDPEVLQVPLPSAVLPLAPRIPGG
jgi:hypothetical protein